MRLGLGRSKGEVNEKVEGTLSGAFLKSACFNLSVFLDILLVFSVTPLKVDQHKKSKSFNRLSPKSGNRKKVDMQRLSPRFRSQQFFLWKICGETFFPNL